MSLQLAILILYVILLVLSLVGVLPIVWWTILIMYLATAQAAAVIAGSGWIKP